MSVILIGMTETESEPVFKDEQLIGYNVHYPASFITVRDNRGYEAMMQLRPARMVFEPLDPQRSIFDEEE